ncbi:MAG: NTPase [Chitinophagaceae bacterium]|nr:NTPase [Chitinophagaceae bacterium]
MWSDNETLSDCIDYNHLISAVTGIIDNPNLLPCSIGIFGDWGSGKSSLMKMVEEKYKDKKDVLVIWFNGWLFEGYEDTKTVLMGRIVDEIISKRTLSAKALKAAAKLLKRIDVLRLSGTAIKYGIGFATMGPVGLAAVSGADLLGKLKDADYEKYITEKKETDSNPDENLRNNIQEFHQNFDELIRETNLEKIVVFIDDLDRCSPDTIIGTLEAIKLFLFTKGTAFVIGADERLIKYAVRRRFPEIPGDSMEVGRDYLEKLIQYPIRIPPLNTIELINYVNLLFSQLHTDVGEFELVRENILKKKQETGFDFVFDVNNADQFLNDLSDELKDSYQLCSQVVPVLSVGLNGNPRQCKRFLNALLIRYGMAKSKGIELNKRILAKLMLLEYFKPETFNSFHQIQTENGGVLPTISLLENKARGKHPEDEDGADQKINTEQEAYLHDVWLKGWLGSEPTLDTVELQPYFYFSRDRLAITGLSLQRMSPSAQEFYKKLLSEAESVSNNALTAAKDLNDGDASAIFEALAQKIRESGKQIGEKSPLKKLFGFCKERQELVSQLMGFLEKFPEKDYPASVVTWLQEATADNQYKGVAKALVQKWGTTKQNSTLAKISKAKQKDFE